MIFDAERRLWLLHTPSTSYALRLDGQEVPRHVYWGPRVELADLRLPAPAGPASSFDRETGEELPAEGGARFGVPSLQIRYPDGALGFQWRYEGHVIDGGHLRIDLRDEHYPLRITLHYQVFDDCQAVERWTTLHHLGDSGPITVLRADSAAWTLPRLPDYRISHTVGDWAAESRLRRFPLPHAETTLTSRRGITSHQANPWVMVDDGQAGEEHGQVWSAALAWSGSWRITLHRDATNRAGFTGGFGHEGIGWQLRPGEQWTTPVFAGIHSPAGFGEASRRWHDYVRRRVLQHPAELRPVVYNSWEATGFAVNEEGQRRLAGLAARVGAELFVMDDGWFSTRASDRSGLGDWTPNADRFPGGLRPLIAEVHRLGMRFGLWVEPEMVNPDSELYRRHPDWVLHMPHRAPTRLRHQLVLNFARSDVAEWAHKWLDQLVLEHEIDFLKWDMNRPFTEAGWPGQPDPDRLWIEHTRNVYAVIDRLRADHPHLRIEACAGGGGRVDLGMLARTDQVWVSDNTDPADRLTIHCGYGQIYPAQTMAAWVTDSPNPMTGRVTPLRYRFHVAMTGALGLGGNLLEWGDDALDEAARLVALYKTIRPVIQHGRLYRLDDAVQYVSADGGEMVLISWSRAASICLSGLDSSARYRDQRSGAEWFGAALVHDGLPLDPPEGDYPSTLVHMKLVPG